MSAGIPFFEASWPEVTVAKSTAESRIRNCFISSALHSCRRDNFSPTVEEVVLQSIEIDRSWTACLALPCSGKVKSVGALFAFELIGPFLSQVIVVFLDHRNAGIVKIVWRFQSGDAGE